MAKAQVFETWEYIWQSWIKFIRFIQSTDKTQRMCLFACGCWKEFVSRLSAIKTWHTKSCWCLHKLLWEKLKVKIETNSIIWSYWIKYLWEANYISNTGRKCIFLCLCWKEFVSLLSSIKNSHTKSCWCIGGNYKHWWWANIKTSNYRLWAGIKRRIFNKKSTSYHRYGWRWIWMFSNWVNNYELFDLRINENLWKKPQWASLDRIDNDWNYEPWNIRWSTPAKQNRNYSENIIIEYKWERLCAIDIWNKYVKNSIKLSWQWFYDRISSWRPYKMAIEHPKTKWRFNFDKLKDQYIDDLLPDKV